MNGRSVLVAGAVLAVSSLAPAQRRALFVPLGSGVEGISAGTLAGLGARSRQQVLLASRLLTAWRGAVLTGFDVRRDRALGLAFQAGSSRLTVTLSDGAAEPSAARPRFADNHGARPRRVFAGVVSLPASPAPSGPIPWDAANTVRVVFDQPFSYRSGALCLEVEGEPIRPPAKFVWMVDYVHEAEPGAVRWIGQGCGEPAARVQPPLLAWERQLVPGGTLSILAFGRAGTPGTMWFSDRLRKPPLALDPFGALGCRLRVDADVALPLLYPRVPGQTVTGADVSLELPPSPTLLAARFLAQAANLEAGRKSNPAGLTTTNALELRMARSMPPGRITTVIGDEVGPGQPFPASGRIEPGRGPILRLWRK